MSSTERLSLPQLRTQAKEFLRAIRVGDPDAQKRALVYFSPETEFVLANAQLVVARENGYSSWAALKRALDHPSIFQAIEDGDVNQVATLLVESPELSSSWRKTSYGGWESALHVCAAQGSIEIAKLLIENGAEIYAVRQSGYPPVDRAHYGRQPAMVEFLLEASAKSDHGHPPTYGVGSISSSPPASVGLIASECTSSEIRSQSIAGAASANRSSTGPPTTAIPKSSRIFSTTTP